jgi:hypothetical protein
MAEKRVEITKDNFFKVFEALTSLTGKSVLVGIPEDENKREDDGAINNAALGYIHEFGSPEANIPARPFLIPGVKNAEPDTARELRKAAEEALNGDMKLADRALNRAGILAVNEVKRVIQSNIPPPLQPETVARRHKSRGTKSMRDSEKVYLDLVAKGTDPEAAQTEAGIVSLINTGQLRNSITYVIRGKR